MIYRGLPDDARRSWTFPESAATLPWRVSVRGSAFLGPERRCLGKSSGFTISPSHGGAGMRMGEESRG